MLRPPQTLRRDIYVGCPPTPLWFGGTSRARFYTWTSAINGLDDPDIKDLVLSDCPSKDDAKLGYLSELLRWHGAHPVDGAERREEFERSARIIKATGTLSSTARRTRPQYLALPRIKVNTIATSRLSL